MCSLCRETKSNNKIRQSKKSCPCPCPACGPQNRSPPRPRAHVPYVAAPPPAGGVAAQKVRAWLSPPSCLGSTSCILKDSGPWSRGASPPFTKKHQDPSFCKVSHLKTRVLALLPRPWSSQAFPQLHPWPDSAHLGLRVFPSTWLRLVSLKKNLMSVCRICEKIHRALPVAFRPGDTGKWADARAGMSPGPSVAFRNHKFNLKATQ